MKRQTTLVLLTVVLLTIACTITTLEGAPALPQDTTLAGYAVSTITTLPTFPMATLTPTATLKAESGQESCRVATGWPGGYLNLRSGPGMSYQVLQVLQEGERVTATGRNMAGWLLVETPAGNGWIYSQFIECLEDGK